MSNRIPSKAQVTPEMRRGKSLVFAPGVEPSEPMPRPGEIMNEIGMVIAVMLGLAVLAELLVAMLPAG